MPDKGKEDGACNRQNCQEPGATWFNRVMNAWYCPPCAMRINQSQRDYSTGVSELELREPLCSPKE